MFYPPRTIREMRQHALKSYPNISVGFLIGNEYVPATNCASDSLNDFDANNYAWLAAKSRRGVQAVVVSKPNNRSYPDAKDMERQAEQNVPWALVATNGKSTKEPIIFGDGAPLQSLYGRHFRHAISDCYALARDYYRLRFGIVLRDYPRNWDWWNYDLSAQDSTTDLYQFYFESAGFRICDEEEARNSAMSGMLFKFRSDRINHAGIITSPKRFLHHISARRPVDFKRISVMDSVHMWRRFTDKWVVFDKKLYDSLPNLYLENEEKRRF